MIDHIRINVKKYRQFLLNHPILKWFVTPTDNGYKLVANFHRLKFISPCDEHGIVFPNANCFINGSLHKFYRSYTGQKVVNSDKFHFVEIVQAFLILSSKFGLDLEQLTCSQIELGVNIAWKCPTPIDFVQRHIWYYKNKGHNHENDFDEKGAQKEFKSGERKVKIYYKSKNLLRVELKFLSFRHLTSYCNSIKSVHNFQSIQSFYEVKSSVLKVLSELFIVDIIHAHEGFSEKEKNTFDNWRNLKFLKEPTKRQSVQKRKEISRLKHEAKILFQKYDLL